MTHRWIALDGLVNMRDLGGLSTRDGGRTQPGRLIRSDNLQDLTEADVATLVGDREVTDIVDLRTGAEVHREGPGPLSRVGSLTHHHHSLLEEHPAERIAEQALALPWTQQQQPRGGTFWAEHYLGYLAKRPEAVSAALRVVAEAKGAVVVHCAAGKDRTGTVVAMALDVAGVGHEDIIADYLLTAERLERVVARLLTRETYRAALLAQKLDDQMPRAESVAALIDTVAERCGDASGWLREHGWSADAVARLRKRLTHPRPAGDPRRRS